MKLVHFPSSGSIAGALKPHRSLDGWGSGHHMRKVWLSKEVGQEHQTGEGTDAENIRPIDNKRGAGPFAFCISYHPLPGLLSERVSGATERQSHAMPIAPASLFFVFTIILSSYREDRGMRRGCPLRDGFARSRSSLTFRSLKAITL